MLALRGTFISFLKVWVSFPQELHTAEQARLLTDTVALSASAVLADKALLYMPRAPSAEDVSRAQAAWPGNTPNVI